MNESQKKTLDALKVYEKAELLKNREYDILPCPFCGNKAELKKSYWIGVDYSVECTKCICRTNSSNNYNEVINAWNTRYNEKEINNGYIYDTRL